MIRPKYINSVPVHDKVYRYIQVCTGIYVSVYRYIYECVQVYIWVCTGIYMSVYRYIYECVQVYTGVYRYIYECVQVYMCIYISCVVPSGRIMYLTCGLCLRQHTWSTCATCNQLTCLTCVPIRSLYQYTTINTGEHNNTPGTRFIWSPNYVYLWKFARDFLRLSQCWL